MPISRKTTLPLIRRLIPNLAPDAIDLVPLSGGRSAAQVFKLTPSCGPGHAGGPPVVVKIAAGLQATKEKTNYDRFVRDGLPAACRPELLGFVRTRTHSGLCYSWVGGPRAETLTQCLQRGEVAKIELILRKIFRPLRDSWYAPALLRAERDIAQRYLERYFTGAHAIARNGGEATLQAWASRYFRARQKDGRHVIGGLSFPSPRATLFASNSKRAYRSCILHGDLNSDNIVVTDNPAGVAMIDFQKTGRGHVYEDLVAVEASIRINYPKDVSFGEVLAQERLIALGRRPRNDPYAATIRKIRDSAFRHFGGVEDAANYHFAVAAIGLRLMQAVDLSHAARARITASTLWAAKALAGERL